MKKQISLFIAIGCMFVVGALAFRGGMVYANHKATARALSAGAGGRIFQGGQGGTFVSRGGQAVRMGGGAVFGSILKKDDTSITVQLSNGGSKTVLLSQKTTVSKEAAGSTNDLATGQAVSVIGTANPDGSITAQTIQIRPDRQ